MNIQFITSWPTRRVNIVVLFILGYIVGFQLINTLCYGASQEYTANIVSEALIRLNKSGGVIMNPSRPEEYYHNAKIFELNGDFNNARKSYIKFFEYKVDAIDVYVKFIDLLLIQEGHNSAKKELAFINNKYNTLSSELGFVLIDDTRDKNNNLWKFISKNKEYAPAYYLLAIGNYENSLGNMTIIEASKCINNFEIFISLANKGHLLNHIVDVNVATNWINKSKEILNTLKAKYSGAIAIPVSMALIPPYDKENNNTGLWILSNIINEHPIKLLIQMGDLEYNESNESELNEICNKQYSAITRKCDIKTIIPVDFEGGEIKLKYFDKNGYEQGPFKVNFSPIDFTIEDLKNNIRDLVKLNSYKKTVLRKGIQYSKPKKDKSDLIDYEEITVKEAHVYNLIKRRFGIDAISFSAPPNNDIYEMKLPKCETDNRNNPYMRGKVLKNICGMPSPTDTGQIAWLRLPTNANGIRIIIKFRNGETLDEFFDEFQDR